eukprot:2394133-Amphidinium_carterae.1
MSRSLVPMRSMKHVQYSFPPSLPFQLVTAAIKKCCRINLNIAAERLLQNSNIPIDLCYL